MTIMGPSPTLFLAVNVQARDSCTVQTEIIIELQYPEALHYPAMFNATHYAYSRALIRNRHKFKSLLNGEDNVHCRRTDITSHAPHIRLNEPIITYVGKH